jgi:hypothetical protein
VLQIAGTLIRAPSTQRRAMLTLRLLTPVIPASIDPPLRKLEGELQNARSNPTRHTLVAELRELGR